MTRNHTRSRVPARAAVLAAALLASGCIVVPARPARPYAVVEAPVVQVAPPPPQEEYIGAAPQAGWIWLGGYWGWNGGRHEWHAGHWEAPRRDERWVPHRWVHEGNGWRLHEGHWERH